MALIKSCLQSGSSITLPTTTLIGSGTASGSITLEKSLLELFSTITFNSGGTYKLDNGNSQSAPGSPVNISDLEFTTKLEYWNSGSSYVSVTLTP